MTIKIQESYIEKEFALRIPKKTALTMADRITNILEIARHHKLIASQVGARIKVFGRSDDIREFQSIWGTDGVNVIH